MTSTLNRLLSLIFLATCVSFAAWFLVIYKLDPYENPKLALPFFFISTLFSFSGLFTLLLFFLKKWRSKEAMTATHVLISLRQGVLLSLCTCICLALLMMGLLRVWNGLLIVAFMMLIEFYLSGKDESN